MVLELIDLGHLPNYTCTKPNSVGVRGCIRKNPSTTLKIDKNMKKFIKSNTLHLTNRFCKDELDTT